MRRISRNGPVFFIAGVLFAVVGGFSAASERCDIVYTNGLDETILGVRVKYSTPYDESRFDSSRIDLPAGGVYRIGVQGTILPELMIIDLATKSFVFHDLTGLNPAGYMRIAIEHKEGKPLIRRTDAEGEAEGIERDYLTIENRPNAVDKDFVLDAATPDELRDLIRERIAEMRANLGEVEAFDVEAGPIWNHQYALERCPEAAREWSGENGREARWTGQWRTTVPGEMSVCDCVVGTADEEGTIFLEDEGWGDRAFFPVSWKEWFGVGLIAERNVFPGGLPIVMRFQLPEVGATAMLNEFLEDLRVDGFRPVRFAVEAAKLDDDGDAIMLIEEEIDFNERDEDKWNAHDRVMESLNAAYAGTALKASLAWVEDDAFEKAKAGGEVSETRGVLCRFTKDTFEAVFLPDAGIFMEIVGKQAMEEERPENTKSGNDGDAKESAQPTLSIPLRGNPSTGYFWSWTAEGDGSVRETDIGYSQDNEMPGTPATYTHFFAGEKEGDVVLRFVYSQTEPAKADDRTNVYMLKVLPDHRIELLTAREDIVGKPQIPLASNIN